MTSPHITRLADSTPTPWRNGGGITHDLLTWPPGAPAWQLRVSVATIDRDGPFSRFDGMARCFCVLSGAGVVLQFADGPVRLQPGDAPLAFDGASAPGCQLIAGPTQDLNLIATQAAGRLAMRAAPPGSPCADGLRWRGLYTPQALVLHIDGQAHTLPAHSLAWCSGADTGSAWQRSRSGSPNNDGQASSPAWWLTLDPA